jgi:putative endonuclease
MAKILEYYVYILASNRNGTLYAGMTGNLGKRVEMHKERNGSKLTGDYEVNKLVYFEVCKNKQAASKREKQLKHWNRRWKIRLIEKNNPTWEDLYAKVENNGSPTAIPTMLESRTSKANDAHNAGSSAENQSSRLRGSTLRFEVNAEVNV